MRDALIFAYLLSALQLAMAGDDAAMARVGHMMLCGYGVKQHPQEAAQWMRQAW